MTSVVEICNMALSKVRAQSINSLGESSLEAQQCDLWYEQTRNFLLSDSPWGFARKTVALALTQETQFNWLHVYQYPSDCLYIERVILNYAAVDNDLGRMNRYRSDDTLIRPDLKRQVEHEVGNINGNKVILCNFSEVRIKYRAEVSDPNLFSMGFIECFAALLGSRLAVPITGGDMGRMLRKENLEEYDALLAAAVGNTLNEEYSEPPDSEFVTIRGG